jgi:selenocysteine lyase/cysteine desulfurase
MESAQMRDTIPYIDSFIHLNSAAGSLADRRVQEAIVAHLEREARRGNTEARLEVAEEISALYTGLSKLVNVPQSCISVAESHTAAWQTAFQAVPLVDGNRILVGETEWGGNLSAIWQRCRATGAVMEVVPSDETGAMDSVALGARLDARVKLVCVTWVPAVNGLINPVDDIAATLNGHPAWLFIDAAQAFMNVVRDFSNPRLDLVTVSARKYLRAPRGTGFATYSQRFLDRIEPLGLDQFSGPWSGLGPVPCSDARKFEFRESSYAVRLGMKAAVDVALARDVDADIARIAELADHARSALTDLPDVTVHDTSASLSGIVTFAHARIPPADIQAALKVKGINIAAPQEPYAPLWVRSGRPSVARISPHGFNRHSDIDAAVVAIAAL